MRVIATTILLFFGFIFFLAWVKLTMVPGMLDLVRYDLPEDIDIISLVFYIWLICFMLGGACAVI